MSATRAGHPVRVAWPRWLSAIAVTGALMLTTGVAAHAGDATAAKRGKASAMPVKAPARPHPKTTVWNWNLIGAKPEPATRPYTATVARQHADALSLQNGDAKAACA